MILRFGVVFGYGKGIGSRRVVTPTWRNKSPRRNSVETMWRRCESGVETRWRRAATTEFPS
jgi:hypothetical protein